MKVLRGRRRSRSKIRCFIADREGKIRRLVDANIIGIFIADREGRILEANDASLRLVGYGREHLVSGRVRWTELFPPQRLRARRTHSG